MLCLPSTPPPCGSFSPLLSLALLCSASNLSRPDAGSWEGDWPPTTDPDLLSFPSSAPGSGSPDSVAKLKLQGSPVPSLRQSLLWGEPAGPPSPPPDPPPSRGPLPLEPICRGPDGRFVMGPQVGTSREKSGPEQSEPRTPARRQARSYDCSSSSPSGMPQPLCIADISPVGPPRPAPPSPLPGPGPLLQYLSLPFFREMNVDGDWLPVEEPRPAPPPDYMDTRPCPTSSNLQPLDCSSESPRAALPGVMVGVGAAPEPPYTALVDWTLRERKSQNGLNTPFPMPGFTHNRSLYLVRKTGSPST